MCAKLEMAVDLISLLKRAVAARCPLLRREIIRYRDDGDGERAKLERKTFLLCFVPIFFSVRSMPFSPEKGVREKNPGCYAFLLDTFSQKCVAD